MWYNLNLNNLDLYNPFILAGGLVAIAVFLFVGHKILIPLYKKYIVKSKRK